MSAADQKTLMDEVYFHQSWLLMAHNVFHSPIPIAYLSVICCCGLPKVRHLLSAYLVGSLTHSILDIISHIGDGPLVL